MTDTTAHQAELSGEALFYVAPEPLSKEAHAKLGIKSLDNPYAFTAPHPPGAGDGDRIRSDRALLPDHLHRRGKRPQWR
ncbi:MAG: hypothetical protein WDN45_13515 [Caulobacteraceae bacterium]